MGNDFDEIKNNLLNNVCNNTFTWKQSLRAGASVSRSPLIETTRSLDWGAQFFEQNNLYRKKKAQGSYIIRPMPLGGDLKKL